MKIQGQYLNLMMHQVVCFTGLGMEPDHRNGDSLDNSRNNLRPANLSQNRHNTGKRSNNTSGYKGVIKQLRNGKWNGKWIARIKNQQQLYYLGIFDDPYEASLAYQRKAIELVGEFTNFG